MITVRNLNGSPESNPGTKFGSHFDGTNFYFFESDQERVYFLNELPKQDIDDLKQQAFNAIDKRTQELIFKGFDFGNCHWSLSISAQINWSNIPNLPESFFPLQMQDQNGVDYQLAYANRMNFYLTAVAAKNTHLQSGNALCKQVDSLTTVDEVNNFMDPR
jgi:hypothetical protein